VSDQTVSHYRIVEKVGAGGMGVVYRAHDDRLNRDVALKFLPDELNHDENARALLIREARTASALNHPNICTIYDVGEADGKNYIVMEFVSGRSLAEQIPEGGLPVETVIRYGEQIADAMAHAHERGVIHRDLKTPNVIVMPGGRVKVLDFGLAKHMTPGEITLKTQSISTLTSEGAIVGTMHYMAPELFRGEPADARSDVWALGVVLYEMANGKRPFRGRTSYELSSMILHDSPPPLREIVPLGLRSVIEHCLAKEPAQRYQHASEIRAALEALRTNSAVIPASAIQASAILPAIAAPRSRLGRALLTASAVAALLLITVFIWKLVEVKWRASPAVGATSIQSLAVLPLENLTGDPKQDYFADGMCDALITELSQIKKLRVISRTSVMQYKDKHENPAQIAQELGVDALVEGSVLRSDDRVRISAELVQPQTGQNLWAHSYERTVTDILALQSDVARDIVTQIQIQLTQPEQERLAKTRTVVPAAYDAYLQGNYFVAKRTGEAVTQAVADYREAIQLDPTYAPSYAGLAGALTLAADYKDVPSSQVLPEAEAAAVKALQLDDNLAYAHAVLGQIRAYRLEWSGVLDEFQRAIELNPGEANSHHWHALALACAGRSDEAISEMKLAQELDPRSLIINANLSWVLYLAARYDEAVAQAQRTVAMDSSFAVAHGYLGQVYLAQRDYAKALQELQQALALSGNETSFKAELGNAYAVAGKKPEALEILRDLLQMYSRQYVSPYTIALVYVGLDQRDEAFQWLDKAYQERSVRLINIAVHPRFASLHSDPRFVALVQRIGLPFVPTSTNTK
jgi:TolB-like protein/tetratricopeptide (TPR) repeat protein/predicted Ser/Thr protein kinase